MSKKLFRIFVSTAALSLCVMASSQANAQDQKDGTNAAASYGYTLHNGKRDPFTDGARSVQDPRDPFTDGAHGAAPFDLAGREMTGVSAHPARSGALASKATA
jgi:hypothetical protein